MQWVVVTWGTAARGGQFRHDPVQFKFGTLNLETIFELAQRLVRLPAVRPSASPLLTFT